MFESTRQQIGKYKIQAELGRGGFGVVYKAYDSTVGRPVAVKVLTALGDNQLLTRFKNEAAAAGNLRHKNIITIYDYGDDDGLPYIVMEFLEGEDLNQIIASRKPMPLLQKVSIMVQVADGLHSAHRAGVVHRDVKPGNIRLLPDGTVKLMDFGIARLVAGSAGTRLTRQGHVIGTLYYMAPEQVLGEEVDSLCDIFAYGTTYYELLTGEHPFQGSDPRAVFHKITSEDPEPIRNLVPDCPEALEKIVNGTLQKDRELRYQTLRDVQLDTEPILIELRQERAESLVIEANVLYSAGELERAQAVLGEASDLDPANRKTRQLRETIQAELLSRLIRPKIAALVKKGDDALSTRRFEEAIESFGAALRLSRDNREVAERLEQARRLLKTSREMARLIADARRALSKQNLERALEILLQVPERDPGNLEAQRLLDDVRTALARREKEREYEEKIQRAKELLQANAFDQAAKLLGDLDSAYKDREEVKKIAAQIRSRKELFERQEHVSKEMAAVRELLARGQLEAAIQRVELLMNRFPDEVEATKLYVLAHKELAAHHKAQTLEKLGKELDRLLKSADFERALELVRQSLHTYPSEPRLLDAQRQIQAEWARHKQEAAILRLVEDSERHLAQHEIEKAVQVLEAAVQQYPENLELAKALGSTREAVAAKLREEGIETLHRQAQAQLNECEYQQALNAIDEGLAKYGSDERLTGIREKVISAKVQWERAEAVREIAEKSRKLVAQNDLKTAVEVLESGLHQFPDERQLIESLATAREELAIRRREDGIEDLCQQAQGQLNQREYQQALDAVEHGLAEYGSDQRLAEMRQQILSAKASWEDAEVVRQFVEDSQGCVARQDFNRAIALLESALERYPGNPELAKAMAATRDALVAKRRDEAIETICRQAQQQIERREFLLALKTVDQGLADHGSDPRFEGVRAKILSLESERERAEAVRRAIEDSHKRLAQGKPGTAVELLETALKSYPDDPQLSEALAVSRNALDLSRREGAIEKLCQQAERALQSREFQGAMLALDRGLRQFASDRRLSDLREKVVAGKAEWERAEGLLQVATDAQRRIAAEQPESAVELLESALSRYPGESQLQEALAAARQASAAKEREQAIETTCRSAEKLLDGHEYQRALEILDEMSVAVGKDQRLTALRNKAVTAKAEWERSQAIRQILEDSRKQVLDQNLQPALELLERALTDYPGQPELLKALAETRQAFEDAQKDIAITELCREVRVFMEREDFPTALALLERGLKTYGSETRLAALRETLLSAQADWQRRDAVRRALNDASGLIAKGEPEKAIHLLEKASARLPGERLLLDALAAARQAAELRRRKESVEKIYALARGQLDRRNFDAALKQVERGLEVDPGNTRFLELRKAISGARTRWEEQRASEAVNSAETISPSPFLVQTETRRALRKWGLLGLTAALVLLASIAVIKRVRAPKLAVLEVRSSPLGATIRVNDQKCSTPTCEFHMKPGQYPIHVSADGYRERTETATLTDAGAQSRMVIVLEPLSPTARITANFADGDVVLDNQRVGRMQDGQFVFERLTPGRHDLQVSSREGRASLSFDADYAKLPSFTNVSQQNAQVIALGSFGNRVTLTCSICSGAVSIDDRQVGELKNRTITIDNVAPGTHRVKVGADQSAVFTASGAPGVHLAVNSSGNFGAVLIQASEENVTVFIDGHKYPRQTSHGQLLIPTEAKQHTIRVAKDGYHAEPPEIRVQLARGDQFQARFKLTPVPARLIVSGQLAGAAVLIDGSPAGTVASNGTFSAQVPPGNRRIEFRKDGYTTAQVQRLFEPGRRLSISRVDAPLVAGAVALPPAPAAAVSSPKPDPNAAEQTDWQRIVGTQSAAQVEDFLTNHPAGIHHEEAQARLKELQQQAAAAREEAWADTKKNSKSSLRQFLSKYGEGTHAQDARTMITAIEKQDADEIANMQRAKEQADHDTTDLKSILNTLSEFEAAYNRKDLTALQGLWGGMPKNIIDSYRNQFRDARTLLFGLKPTARAAISGDTATAICVRTLSFTARNGEHPPETNERVQVTLSRSGTQWLIRTITPF